MHKEPESDVGGDRPNDEPRRRSKRKHPMLPVAMKVSRSKQRKDRRRKKTLKSKREVARLRAHQQRRAVIHGPASLIQLTLSGSVLDVNEEFSIGCPWLRKTTLSSVMDGTTSTLGQLWHGQRAKWKTRTIGFVVRSRTMALTCYVVRSMG